MFTSLVKPLSSRGSCGRMFLTLAAHRSSQTVACSAFYCFSSSAPQGNHICAEYFNISTGVWGQRLPPLYPPSFGGVIGVTIK